MKKLLLARGPKGSASLRQFEAAKPDPDIRALLTEKKISPVSFKAPDSLGPMLSREARKIGVTRSALILSLVVRHLQASTGAPGDTSDPLIAALTNLVKATQRAIADGRIDDVEKIVVRRWAARSLDRLLWDGEATA